MGDTSHSYFLCIANNGYDVSLQVRTIYRGQSDPEAEAHGMVRIVDESGEDFLFPAKLFVPIEVPAAAAHAFAGAA